MKNFSTSLEHLIVELQLLDLHLQRQVMRLRATNQLTEDGMRGLYIPDSQVDALLSQPAHRWHLPFRNEEPREAQTLNSAIQRLREENALRVRMSPTLPLSRLATLFDLQPDERQVLLISVAPELDLRYETLYAYAQNAVPKQQPTR